MKMADIIGQADVKSRLIQAVKEDHLAHALRFQGPEGSGNLAIAIAFAQYILCKNRQEGDSCGTCPSCIKCKELAHPDMHFSFPILKSKDLDSCDPVMNEFRTAVKNNPYLNLRDWLDSVGGENKLGTIGKGQSDEIMRKLSLKSFERGYKIMIIWRPETMNASAANKLLKTIEEPPAKTLIFLVTCNSDQLLGTILSRTQMVRVGRLKFEEIANALVEKQGMTEEDAKRIALLADGNWESALQHAEQQEEDNERFVLFQNWMRSCYKRDVVEVIANAEAIAALQREKQKDFLQYALHMFRQALSISYSGDQFLHITGDEANFIQNFAPHVTAELVGISADFNEAHYHVERYGNGKVIFLDLSFKLMGHMKQIRVRNREKSTV